MTCRALLRGPFPRLKWQSYLRGVAQIAILPSARQGGATSALGTYGAPLAPLALRGRHWRHGHARGVTSPIGV